MSDFPNYIQSDAMGCGSINAILFNEQIGLKEEIKG